MTNFILFCISLHRFLNKFTQNQYHYDYLSFPRSSGRRLKPEGKEKGRFHNYENAPH